MIALVVLSATVCRADTVMLTSGEAIIGRVLLEQSDDEVLVVDEARSGTRRELAWNTVGEGDAARLQAEGRKANGGTWYTATVPGERIIWRVGPAEREARGLVEREDVGVVALREATSSDVLRIAVADIVRREPVSLHPQDVWPAADLFARKQAALDPHDHRAWMRLAAYGERLGADDLARVAYERAAAATEDVALRDGARAAATRAAQRVTAEAAASRALGEARALLDASRWADTRSALEGFRLANPAAAERVRLAFDELRADFRRLRIAHFASRAGADYDSIGRRLIRARVRVRAATFDDVLAWMRKELPDEIVAALVEVYRREDPAVTAEDARAFFAARPNSAAGWRRASYDSGSFLVAGVAIPPARRESWWESASEETRTRFVWASAVEAYGVFEVRAVPAGVPCSTCDGAGRLKKLTNGGAGLEYVCPRCNGVRVDVVLAYR